MRSPFLIVAALSALSPSCLAQHERRALEPVELKHFTYELETFEAPSLKQGNGEFGIYLPEGYGQGEQRYPLVLWLHGMNEDASRFKSGGGARVLDQMRGEGKIPPLILVAPSAPRRTIYADGEGAGDVETFILRDLMTHIEKKYRISKQRGDRAIMGVSMGGMGALRIVLGDPSRFGAVAVHSAAAFPADISDLSGESGERIERTLQWLGITELLGDPLDPEKWARYIPSAMIGKLKREDLKGLRIYFDAGTEDRYGFGPPNEEFHRLLEEREIPHSFTLVEGGGHSWGSGTIQHRLEFSLKFVAEGFSAKAGDSDAKKEV
ncbi:MAG: alpha/beta hydrolase-fold protein [Planctomycetota bacterium]